MTADPTTGSWHRQSGRRRYHGYHYRGKSPAPVEKVVRVRAITSQAGRLLDGWVDPAWPALSLSSLPALFCEPPQQEVPVSSELCDNVVVGGPSQVDANQPPVGRAKKDLVRGATFTARY